MANIGGNITGTIQTKAIVDTNEIGEAVYEWTTAYSTIGWLGMTGGNSRYSTYNAKIEESTHVFLCDYHSGIYALAEQDTRMTIKGFLYDVTFIDNPDEMDEQLEIFLKRVGAESGI